MGDDLYAGAVIDVESPPDRSYGSTGASPARFARAPEPERFAFRQEALWASLALFFFAFLTAVLYAFTSSGAFEQFVVKEANALFTIPYVLSFFVIIVCLAPWAGVQPNTARASGALNDMNAGVISSFSDYCLLLLVLIEWATCLALVLVTLIAVHDGLSYISTDGLILPRKPGEATPVSSAAPGASGISRDSFLVLIIPFICMWTVFNFIMHLWSCIESMVRRHRSMDDLD